MHLRVVKILDTTCAGVPFCSSSLKNTKISETWVYMGIRFLRDRKVCSMTMSYVDGCSCCKNDLHCARISINKN